MAVITHNADIAEMADRVVRVSDGGDHGHRAECAPEEGRARDAVVIP